MGAFQSKSGGGNVQPIITSASESNRSETQQQIDGMLTDLLNRHMSKFQDKSFCKRTKLFIRDKVLMKTAENDLSEIEGNIFVGEIVGGAEDRPQLCDRLAHHYLKKMNLVASIHATLQKTYARLDALQKGGQCYSAQKFSEAPYEPYFQGVREVKHGNMMTSYPFSTRHTLEVDGNEIRKMALEKVMSENKDYAFSDESNRRLLFREIVTPQKCSAQGGTWLKDSDELVRRGLTPATDLESYNKTWHGILQKTEANVVQRAGTLLEIMGNILEESVEEKDGVKQKVYLDKSVTRDELQGYIDDTRGHIQDIIAEVDKAYLLLSDTPVISVTDLEQQKQLQEKQKALTEELQGLEKRFARSV